MSQNIAPALPNKTCSTCKHSASVEDFFRKGKVWKTCNECSAKTYNQRKAETAYAEIACNNLDMGMAGLHIGQQQQQFNLMLQLMGANQNCFYQQQFENQCTQQRDQRMTLEFLLADRDVYEPTPLEVYEQRRRSIHQTQQLYTPEILNSHSDQQSLTYQNSQLELSVQPFLTCPVDPNQGMLPDYGLLDLNPYCNFEANGDEQTGSSFDNPDAGEKDLDFDECLANALLLGLIDLQGGNGAEQPISNEPNFDLDMDIMRSDSMFQDEPDALHLSHSYAEAPGENDINMVGSIPIMQGDTSSSISGVLQGQHQGPSKRVRKPRTEAPSFSLNMYFADFSTSEDILRQPLSPDYTLSGAALVKHLISELGLAMRLSELHRRWNYNQKLANWFKEVDLLDRLEERGILTPWGPLSDWLVLYQNGMEELLDRYGHGSNIDWQAERKVRADKVHLSKVLKANLREEYLQLIRVNTEALFKLFIDVIGQQDLNKLKIALDKQIRLMKAAVTEDCKQNGVLRLKTGPNGTYVDV